MNSTHIKIVFTGLHLSVLLIDERNLLMKTKFIENCRKGFFFFGKTDLEERENEQMLIFF